MENQSSNNLDGFVGGGSMVTPEQPKPLSYMSADHQIPDHATPDPVESRASLVSSAYPSLDKAKDETVSPSWGEPSKPSFSGSSFSMPTDDRPIPVVKVLSVRGIEYAMMSILLWFGAGSLIYLLVSLVVGNSSFETLAFPLSLLLVCVPGFAFLFSRLRKAELADPSLRLEASKRRFSQITQILAFLTCFFNIVTVVYALISLAGGGESEGIGKMLGAAAVVLVVAGGILAYYWFDEHKLVGRR